MYRWFKDSIFLFKIQGLGKHLQKVRTFFTELLHRFCLAVSEIIYCRERNIVFRGIEDTFFSPKMSDFRHKYVL